LRRKCAAVAETITRYSREVWPRVILSHCLLEEGSDRAAAEKALLEILEFDPGNAGARHNLHVLRGRSPGVTCRRLDTAFITSV